MISPLLRALAPISDRAWQAIDDEARRALRHFMSARRLGDVTGPQGWDLAAVSTGRSRATGSTVDGVELGVRESLALVETRCGVRLDRTELDDLDRGGEAADLDPLTLAARSFAEAEDTMVFDGPSAAVVMGIAGGSPHSALEIEDDYERYPNTIAAALMVLRQAGVEGPYGIALGPRCFAGVIETTEKGGYPLLEHIRLQLGGPVVWSPGLDGAVIASLRGGDFELVLGQDVSIAYRSHDDSSVSLELRGSSTFGNLAPEAAIALRYDTPDCRHAVNEIGSLNQTGRSPSGW